MHYMSHFLYGLDPRPEIPLQPQILPELLQIIEFLPDVLHIE